MKLNLKTTGNCRSFSNLLSILYLYLSILGLLFKFFLFYLLILFILSSGLNVSLASLYLAEISPKKIRGAIGTCHQLFITIGILWSNIMGVSKLAGNFTKYILVLNLIAENV